MAKFDNFYENIAEARLRLRGTVVMYDRHPYYVVNFANHFKDGAIRIYLVRLDHEQIPGYFTKGCPMHTDWGDGDANQYAAELDAWLASADDTYGIIRKRMDSPKFNKFRPFDLGNCNMGGTVQYIERMPKRHTLQGLSSNSMVVTPVDLSVSDGPIQRNPYNAVNVYNPDLIRTILGKYPSPEQCIKHLLDKDCDNKGLAFSREFSFIRGPVNTLFVAYKTKAIGIVPNNDLSVVRLSQEYKFLRESLEELDVFNNIVV